MALDNNSATIMNARMKLSLVTAALFASLACELTIAADWPSGREVVEIQAEPFDLKDVRLLAGPFRDAMLRTQRYLRELQSDDLLWHFRRTAGLKAPGKSLGGWEKAELRGHTMGHYLSACALMYASTGNEQLKTKADEIVAELAKCQQALGTGYLSAFPESHIDRVVALKPVWAPWYTLHKIYAGLIDEYVYTGNQQALEVAQKMAAWAKCRIDKLDDAAMQQMLEHTEQGGMNEALANLYGVTGDQRWIELSERFNESQYFKPLLEHRDQLAGQHANSFIPNMVGSARQYELTGNLQQRHVAEFFWRSVVDGRSFCTGGTSFDEGWRGAPFDMAQQLGNNTQESCCTYNMLKLTRHLFAWEPRAEYFDYYERNLLNSVLATQDPSTGMMSYFVAMAPGRWKFFNTLRDSFWCCTGSGLESHSKYGDSIFFHNDDTLWVNLFIASELNWRDKHVIVRQETSFPESPKTTLKVQADEPTEFELRLRVPHWATSGVTLSINGEPQPVTAQASSYFAIRRTWSDGDRIEYEMPMRLWLSPLPGDSNHAAILYGPLVLAGELGKVDAPDDMVYTTENWFQFPEDRIVDEPLLVTNDRDPAKWIAPVQDEPLTFRTQGVGRPNDVTLIPYYRLWDQKYAIYWQIVGDAEFERTNADRQQRQLARTHQLERRAALEAHQLDAVAIGDKESELRHKLQFEDSRSGERSGYRWRDAGPQGRFEYRLAVEPDAPVVLLCRYWGSDKGREFDIFVDGQLLATQSLNRQRPEEFVDVEYNIPAEMTQGKASVVVRFAGRGQVRVGGVFGCSTHRQVP
jgi:uncharacterized protein